jgi:hypothetical protein
MATEEEGLQLYNGTVFRFQQEIVEEIAHTSNSWSQCCVNQSLKFVFAQTSNSISNYLHGAVMIRSEYLTAYLSATVAWACAGRVPALWEIVSFLHICHIYFNNDLKNVYFFFF